MAENVFLHGSCGPGGKFTLQLVYDPEAPAGPGLMYRGRVLDVHGATAFESPWATGNAPAIYAVEAWCKSPAAAEYRVASPVEDTDDAPAVDSDVEPADATAEK